MGSARSADTARTGSYHAAMYDLFVEKNMHDEDLVSNVATLLNVKPSDVLLIDDVTKIADHREHPVAVARREHTAGYRLFVSIFFRQNACEESEFAGKLSRAVGMNVLYAAESDDMYEWVRVSPDGESERVLLCVDPFDEDEDAVPCGSPADGSDWLHGTVR
jgi:hypothetical protein